MQILYVIQIVSGVLLTIFILAQQRGSGLGSIGGSSSGGEMFSSRRGVEKIIFNVTVVLMIAFVASSIINYIS